MEFTLYIGLKKVKHAIGYILVNMHAQDFQEPREDIIWTKTPSKPRRSQKCNTIKGDPNYI